MKNSTFIVLTVVLLVAIVGLVSILAARSGNTETVAGGERLLATVHKSPTCGCCGVFASYLGRQGYDVDVHNVADMANVKNELNVPHELESCHTTEVAGYVIEGHIPHEAIEKLLAENPDIRGIGMPGMPSGSPGMPGAKTGDFVIYEITEAGERGDVFVTL